MRGLMAFLAGAAVALAIGWGAFPRVIYRSQAQPVDFSHKVHAEKAGSQCVDCHAFRDDGTYAGVPTLDKCAACHAAPMGSTAAEKAFIEQYITPNREPAWLSYARQPENVFFSHITHVQRGQLQCEQCHGAVGTSDHLRPLETDRISGYSRDIWGAAGRPGMTMDNCVKCHRQRHLEHSCLDCHK
jgi:menaquinone reductase, multiheme cytochrome c subunit